MTVSSLPAWISLSVTPYRERCARSPDYLRCGNRCVRRELFCDGQVNCLPSPGTAKPKGEEAVRGRHVQGQKFALEAEFEIETEKKFLPRLGLRLRLTIQGFQGNELRLKLL